MFVDVQIASTVSSIPDTIEIQSCVSDVLRELAFSGECEVSVRIVDEKEGRDLNRQHRDMDKATNVLSFPPDRETAGHLPPDVPCSLGDIVICGPIVEREAAEQGREIAAHWAHLLVHGTLHLLGHDHKDDVEAAAMEAIETRILVRRGFEDPYS